MCSKISVGCANNSGWFPFFLCAFGVFWSCSGSKRTDPDPHGRKARARPAKIGTVQEIPKETLSVSEARFRLGHKGDLKVAAVIIRDDSAGVRCLRTQSTHGRSCPPPYYTIGDTRPFKEAPTSLIKAKMLLKMTTSFPELARGELMLFVGYWCPQKRVGLFCVKEIYRPSPAAIRAHLKKRAKDEGGAMARILAYIKKAWDDLTRSHKNVLSSFEKGVRREPPIIYISRKESIERVKAELLSSAGAAAAGKVSVRALPDRIDRIREHGLLYLPHPYVVPGGRFVEQYGWDSYFIMLGLMEENRFDLAVSMVNNFLYEIEHYGFVLNANRTYFLTRSQPPFLTRMIMAVAPKVKDPAWLERAYKAAVDYYRLWAPMEGKVPVRHLSRTGLARYYDNGKGPAPEVMGDRDSKTKENHYDRVRAFYKKVSSRAALGKSALGETLGYKLGQYYSASRDGLTEAFYKGDRAMRESGFDPSDRFGRFSVDIVNYNPVELNVLLWVMEKDLLSLSTKLKKTDRAAFFKKAAESRARRIQNHLWDEERGLFMDYNVIKGRRSRYPFVTTFFPLWAGLATKEQARRVACNLHLFETMGGVQTSPFVTGSQWDAPFVWAPTQLVAVQGLRRYGYEQEARRLSRNYLSMVLADFKRTKTIVEKYDGVKRTSKVQLTYGYTTQEIGFGWTNAAFLVLLEGLPPADRRMLEGFRPEVAPKAAGRAEPACPAPKKPPTSASW